jgi:hypothetical protein
MHAIQKKLVVIRLLSRSLLQKLIAPKRIPTRHLNKIANKLKSSISAKRLTVNEGGGGMREGVEVACQ